MIFREKRIASLLNPNFHIKGCMIEEVLNFKYLDIALSSNLCEKGDVTWLLEY